MRALFSSEPFIGGLIPYVLRKVKESEIQGS